MTSRTRGGAQESVAAFRARAAAWAPSGLPRRGEVELPTMAAKVEHARALQASLFDAGLAGITWPQEYGGQGLTVEHLRALDEELRDYETPYWLLSVSVGIVGPTLVEVGTEQQKQRHVPRILRGDELWVQYFSEPTGGSDLAGATTRATRDGDTWVLNGSKVWTTFGQYADHALCLARTDWSQPKHRGLSMFIVEIPCPGLTVVPLRQANGSAEFCQEFLDDVAVPASALVGAENDGWSVATRLLTHERNALGGGSTWFSLGQSGGGRRGDDDIGRTLADRAAKVGTWEDPLVRDAVVDVHVSSLLAPALAARVRTGMATGSLQGPAGSILKLFTAMAGLRRAEVSLAVHGAAGGSWPVGDAAGEAALSFLVRQGGSLAGGTDEIQRNIISERILGLPREHAPDRDVPFEQVRRNTLPSSRG